MKNIDSDFEDLGEREDLVSSAQVSTQPQSAKVQPVEEKQIEPVVEPMKAPVVEKEIISAESSEEECIEQEVTCWKCNGSKRNKKGKPCKKCEGSGFIRSNELATLMPLIRDEVRTFCRTSFTGLL